MSDTREDVLKNCPFCGSDKITITTFPLRPEVEAGECLSCAALAPIAAWNKRTPSDAVAKLVEEARQTLSFAQIVYGKLPFHYQREMGGISKRYEAMIAALAPFTGGKE